jgi:hypothetical protein
LNGQRRTVASNQLQAPLTFTHRIHHAVVDGLALVLRSHQQPSGSTAYWTLVVISFAWPAPFLASPPCPRRVALQDVESLVVKLFECYDKVVGPLVVLPCCKYKNDLGFT